ncbi:MAG TPA: GNAT family N-acetyltransferase [Actinomycetota bacterium]|nr:GNAT family N-acetyltransferase [Actinomycetota bacterium]
MTTDPESPTPQAAVDLVVRTELRDGTHVVIRPIRPDDKALLTDGFGRLSEESRYRRFLAPVSALTDAMLAYLTEIDYVDHFAWVAALADQPDTGVGVARYVRLKDEPTVAEAAITVVDQYQGRGLGSILLGLLGARATEVGITAFRAYVLEDNDPMRELLEGLGAVAHHDSPGVLLFDVPLDLEQLHESPAKRVLRAVARRILPAKVRLEL